MRRYTAVKSNVYAPTSTNVIQQHMLHCHMTYHYRMMYNAKSKVDSSPPRHYKGRGLPSSDCSRKKLNKYPARSNKAKTSHRTDADLQNQSLIDRILYDTKLPPSAYVNECLTQRQHKKGLLKNKVDRGEDYGLGSKGSCECHGIDVVPSLNISSQKVKQVPQFRDFVNQPWGKRVISGKWNSCLVKHCENPQDVVRNNIPRQISKPRLYHSSQCRRLLFQGEQPCISSGSEGNAGDDEDGAPTSSYDDSNHSDNEKHKFIGRALVSSECGTFFKTTPNKRLGKSCICIPAVEKTKKTAASEISSRDSAYEGGEGMSSTEKERTSPDRVDDRIRQCVGLHFGNGSKGESMSCPLPVEEDPLCFKSELYMKFLQDVTDDILVQGAYTNEALEKLFQEHINNNAYSLDLEHLKVMVKKLGEDLGMPNISFTEEKLFEERSPKQLIPSIEKRGNSEYVCPSPLENRHSAVKKVVANPSNPKSDIENEVDNDYGLWTNKTISTSGSVSSSSVVIIDKNFTMSKKEILDNLVYLDFDETMAEEIYHILAGKGGLYPDFTVKELQDIIQQ
ncbi:uncharacterized protein LOC124166378 [Ischnura elegans]|uniref:uncharacterized protein LOC124166378 n=1 Tax=Ischnura elegans TaxID=197161 RepID=UPI001ED8B41E|nr:uncharacterized protein LOC124166378 [Ischnura elegans]